MSQNVSFSSKELFLEINRKLDGLTVQLNTKVDKTEIERLELIVMDLQRKGGDAAQQALQLAQAARERVEALEKASATSSAVRENAERIEKEHKNSSWQWLAITMTGLGVIAQLVINFLEKR